MRITVTNINFKYADGNGELQGANLYFNSTGATFNLNGYVEAGKDEYLAAAADESQLADLIKQKVSANLTTNTTDTEQTAS
ncbi:hypothetical protein P9G49_04090 [Heyndrickxia coagulans]|uniref:hypothetical protein n=1 Tax=Heyndrickxia coagulans TaxID=1398 RepID=UPI002DFB4CAC|nr:hypothetical protein [Heyndrickxia coagulans]